MGRRILMLLAVSIALSVAVGGCAAPAGPSIRAENVWSRPAVAMGEMKKDEPTEGDMGGMGSIGVVYLTLVNKGREADRLIGAQSGVAATAELHQTTMTEAGVMKM